MASLFRNAANNVLGTANCVIYTTPATANAVIFSLFVTNTGGADTRANVVMYDSSADKYFSIAYKLAIVESNGWYIDKPIELMPSDQLYVRAANCDVVCSILELS